MSDEDNKKDCELPFWRDFSILFKDFSLEYKPKCPHSAWNFATRLILLSLFIGMIASVLRRPPSNGCYDNVWYVYCTCNYIYNKAWPNDNGRDKKWDTYHKLPYIANVDPEDT
jgi:hypothetical protein